MDWKHRLINGVTGIYMALLVLFGITSIYIAVSEQSWEPLLFFWFACLVLNFGYWLIASTLAWLLTGKFAIWFNRNS